MLNEVVLPGKTTRNVVTIEWFCIMIMLLHPLASQAIEWFLFPRMVAQKIS